jgi:hypothetical protein
MQCKTCEAHPLTFNGCLTRRCEECQSSRIDRQLKLCKKCSKTLGECQRCRTKPGAEKSVTANPKSGARAAVKTAAAAPGDPNAMTKNTKPHTCSTCAATPLPTHARAGNCANCTSLTGSTAYKLCDPCSGKLNCCNRCRRPMGKPSQPGGKSTGKAKKRSGRKSGGR